MKTKIKTPVTIDNINNAIIDAAGEVICRTSSAEYNAIIAASINEHLRLSREAASRIGKLGGRPSAFARKEVRERTRELVIEAQAAGREINFHEIARTLSSEGSQTTARSVQRFLSGQ